MHITRRPIFPHPHKTYRRPPNPVYPHPTFSHHRRRRDERPGWRGTGFLGGRLREGQNCAATSLPPKAGVLPKGSGDGPQRFKSTGHAKNPGCMRRCMSHLFITQTGHAPSHAACLWTPSGLWPDGALGCARLRRTTTIPAPPPSSSPRRRGSSAPRRRCGRQILRAGLPLLDSRLRGNDGVDVASAEGGGGGRLNQKG